MNKKIEKTLKDLNEKICLRESTLTDIVKDVPPIIEILESGFEKIKEIVAQYQFTSNEEEIHFFKEQKPKLFSKLIYYKKIYRITLNLPLSGYQAQMNYLKTDLKEIDEFCDKHSKFIQYYRSGDVFMDESFFLRGKKDTSFFPDCFYFERDPLFSTPFDLKTAKLLANDLLAVFLNRELQKLKLLENSPEILFEFHSDAHWTAGKIFIEELIYAIHSAKSVNSGNISVKALAAMFEKMFNIDLSDIYQGFRDIRNRKIDRTVYLNILTHALTQRMDTKDE